MRATCGSVGFRTRIKQVDRHRQSRQQADRDRAQGGRVGFCGQGCAGRIHAAAEGHIRICSTGNAAASGSGRDRTAAQKRAGRSVEQAVETVTVTFTDRALDKARLAGAIKAAYAEAP
jgi:hypothetical protein